VSRPDAVQVRTYAFVSLVWMLALVAGITAWQLHAPHSRPWALLLLVGLGLVGWLGGDNNVGQRIQFSLISIVILAAIVIVGPVGAALVGAVVSALSPHALPLRARAFNAGMFAFLGAAGGLVYMAMGGSLQLASQTGAVELTLHVGLPLLLAEVVQCVLNALLLAGIQSVANAVPARAQVWSLLATTGPAYVGYGIIGFLFVVLWLPARVGWFSAVLVLAPLFVARWAFAQYGDELRAHERTLRALVTAVETKEPQNQGHSERVAQLSEWIAESLGLGHKEIQDVRTAGMLHDVGKVAVPTRLLRSRSTLTDDELVVLADHARAGVDLVKDIGFLAASLEGIAHHHERWDGRGYPAGLAGDRIPLTARIIAVADAFDALTSPRPYRPAEPAERALAELSRRGGTHLDPAMVEALARVVARHGWEPTVRQGDVRTVTSAAHDHDDPEMSDYFAEHPDLREQLRVMAEQPAEPRHATQAAPSTAGRRTASRSATSEPDHHVGGRV
jgi:HD-GYP domain-containing protein (c-di-GMP phosphodiesterase class II)